MIKNNTIRNRQIQKKSILRQMLKTMTTAMHRLHTPVTTAAMQCFISANETQIMRNCVHCNNSYAYKYQLSTHINKYILSQIYWH